MISKLSPFENQLVDTTFITRLLGASDRRIYRLTKDGIFPKLTKLGRSSRWLQNEVEARLQVKIDESCS